MSVPVHKFTLYSPPSQICLCDFESGDMLRQLPCKHEFHQPCIDSWAAHHRTCPNCRYLLWEPPAPWVQPEVVMAAVPPSANAMASVLPSADAMAPMLPSSDGDSMADVPPSSDADQAGGMTAEEASRAELAQPWDVSPAELVQPASDDLAQPAWETSIV